MYAYHSNWKTSREETKHSTTFSYSSLLSKSLLACRGHGKLSSGPMTSSMTLAIVHTLSGKNRNSVAGGDLVQYVQHYLSLNWYFLVTTLELQSSNRIALKSNIFIDTQSERTPHSLYTYTTRRISSLQRDRA